MIEFVILSNVNTYFGSNRSLCLGVQLTISQHRFRYWLSADQTTSRYLDQWWSTLLRHICVTQPLWVNTLRLRQNGCRFADNTFKCIFLNEDVRISIKISLKFVPKGPINNNPSLVQIMAWRGSGAFWVGIPSEYRSQEQAMLTNLIKHYCYYYYY